jgi:cytochrome bd ubiquinol oxidase subunit II
MVETWYALLSFMLLAYVVLEGFDIGAGMLQYVVGKTEAERRTVIAAIGPLWSWHEVWLVAFGGTLLMAFPPILAASFAGFYLALILLLWALIFRGVSIEFSGHLADPLWRTGWHFCFVASNVLLAILLGAALGNVVRGVPVGASGKFAMALFTDFTPGGEVGLLDWYTISVAVFILAAFATHGAIGLAHRTEGPVHDRSLRVASFLWRIVLVLLVVVTVETRHVRREFFPEMFREPFGWIGVICLAAGAIAVFAGLHGKRALPALAGSSTVIAGLMIAGAAGVFPFMLRSTIAPEYSMSAYKTAADGYGLGVALIWWPIALVLAVGYFLFIYKHYSGKVKLQEDTQIPY